MPEAGTQTSLAHAGSRPRLARNGIGRRGNRTTRVQRVPPEEWRMAEAKWRMTSTG